MIDRKELANEMRLRENIRAALSIVLKRRHTTALAEAKNEKKLRHIIRELISEGQSAVAAVAKHDSTGINALEDLLKNSNVLFVLETGYKSLTTAAEQRDSYKNHILNAITASLAPEESRKEAGEDVELKEELEEEVDIEIGDRPEDDPDFIDVNDDDDGEEEEVDERDGFGLDGEDKTGRNRAFTDFHKIEKDILTSFDDLDNPEDIAMFEEYLLKNLVLYFEKFEGELETNVPPPEEAEGAVADVPAAAAAEDAAETDIPEFALEEVMKHLDIEDIIENLL